MTNPPSTISQLARQIHIFNSLVTKLAGRAHEERLSLQLPGVSGLQFGVMQILGKGSFTLSEIANKMMLTAATLVPVVDRLEKSKLVVRGADANDRRRRPLHLTALGQEMLGCISPFDEEELITRSLNEMGEEKAQQLNGLLQELLHHLSPDADYVAQVLEQLQRSSRQIEE
jgi:DNA-binding MarR family transcriptional regulator